VALDLAWLIGMPVTIDASTSPRTGATCASDATVNWSGQRAGKRGEIKRGASGW
jgi:hypothetical protein